MDTGPAQCRTCTTKNTHPNDVVRAAIAAANALDVQMYARVLAQTPSAPAVSHASEPQTLEDCCLLQMPQSILILTSRSRPAPGQDADFGRKRDAAREAQLARCRAEEEAATARSELTPLCRSISSDEIEWLAWFGPLYAPGKHFI